MDWRVGFTLAPHRARDTFPPAGALRAKIENRVLVDDVVVEQMADELLVCFTAKGHLSPRSAINRGQELVFSAMHNAGFGSYRILEISVTELALFNRRAALVTGGQG